MIIRFNPHLYFKSACRDAMTQYQHVFGGSLELNTFADFGMDGDPDDVLNALLITDHLVLSAGDVTVGSPAATGGSISVQGDDATQLRGWFDALTEGGEVHMPLEAAMWGGLFGQCADRFGVTWLFHVGAGTD